ncbi:MAG: hypothetical protein ACT4QE_19790 [Anaerolineales bacterium]
MTHASSTPLPRNRWLLIGLLTGPVVWAVYFLVAYLVGEFGCLSGALQFAVLGVPAVTAIVTLLTAIALIAVLIAGWKTFEVWQQMKALDDTEAAGREQARTRFLGFGGLLLSGLFAYAILLNGVPALVLRPC